MFQVSTVMLLLRCIHVTVICVLGHTSLLSSEVRMFLSAVPLSQQDLYDQDAYVHSSATGQVQQMGNLWRLKLLWGTLTENWWFLS